METSEIQNKDESSDNSAFGSCTPETSALRPVCLDDVTNGNLPESFRRIKSFFSEVELNSNEILAIALYIMAVESGFTSEVEDDILLRECCYTYDSRRIKRIIPQFITSGLSSDREFIFPLYLGSSEKSILQMKPFLGRFLVNLFHPDSLVCFSKILDVSSYVSVNADFNTIKLKELSMICKNDIFCPMKAYCLRPLGIKHACLLNLPAEILLILMKCIRVKDFLSLCASCRYFHDNFRDNAIIWNFYEKKSGRLCRPSRSRIK